MAGEITLRELSPKLREFIENSGGGGSINANIKICGFVAEENQTTFTVPFDNYVADICYLDVKVNSIWVSPEEYTINGKEVTFGTALNAGTEVFFTVYLLGATALESVSADVVLENESKQFVTATEKSKITEIDNVYKKPIDMPNGTDVKECYETGLYRSYGWLDFPSDCPDGQGVLIVTNWGGDAETGWVHQEFITPHNKNRYIRSYTGGIIGEWYKVAIASETQSKLPSEYQIDFTQMILNYSTAKLRFTHSNNQAYIQAGTKDDTKGVLNFTGYNGDQLTGLNMTAVNDNVTINGKLVATTTKTPFTCTANTGFTITNQNCYRINNEIVFNVDIKRTDGSDIGITAQNIFTLPYKPSAEFSVTSVARSSGYGLMNSFVQTVLNVSGEAWSMVNTPCGYISVSGRFEL